MVGTFIINTQERPLQRLGVLQNLLSSSVLKVGKELQYLSEFK